MLVKTPVPVPSEVLLLAKVGPAAVFQQTPLSVVDAPPSSETFPPEVAEEDVTLLAIVVVKVGSTRSTGGMHPVKTIDNKNNKSKEGVLTLLLFFIAINL